MSNSLLYRDLKREVSNLRRFLLPRKFNPLGIYTPRQHQLAKSFQVHVHAEIEYFLEESLRGIVTAAKDAVLRNGGCVCLLCLLDAKEVTIKKNHGVKEGNVTRMFQDVGMDFSKLPATLLADLTSYGQSRGLVAHNSRNVYCASASVLSDPKTEWSKALQLVADLADFDFEIEQIKRSL